MGWDPALLKPHGTAAAYRRHHRHSEKPCVPCQQAEARRRSDISLAGRHARYIASRPIPVVHYGHHRATCGRRSPYGVALTTDLPEVTCLLCMFSRAFRDALDTEAAR